MVNKDMQKTAKCDYGYDAPQVVFICGMVAILDIMAAAQYVTFFNEHEFVDAAWTAVISWQSHLFGKSKKKKVYLIGFHKQ